LKKFLKLCLVAMLALGLVVVAGCGQDAVDESQPPADESQITSIVVGTNATFPPFESQDKGELVGFDMELIRAIGEVQGIEVEVQHMDFKSLVPGVQQGKIDAAIAGMSITPERLEVVNFTDSYFDAGLIVAVKSDNEDILGPDDLKGKVLAAQNGTIGAAFIQEVAKEDPSTEVKLFDDVGVAFMELNKGGADAVVNDQPVTLNYILTTEDASIKTVGEVFSADDKYGIAVQRDNIELLTLLNEGLAKVRENGTYDEIYSKWIVE